MDENQPPKIPQSENQPAALEAAPKRRRWLLAALGFAGWYLVNGLFWLIYQRLRPIPPGYYDIFSPDVGAGMITTVINIVVLLALAFIRRTRWVALGILFALALNFAVSLVLGLGFNAFCLAPFFTPFR